MSNKGYVITKIEIVSFGKLKNAVIAPSDGINVMTLPNESGKSTLAAFLKFVLYGFSGAKKQSLFENEKARCMPWDGTAAQGAVTVCAAGKTYRVARKTSGRDDSVTVTDTVTGEAAFPGAVPGVAIFGISDDTFVKSLFVGQSAEFKNGDPALAEQLRNLLFSADEKTNVDKAVKRLRDAKAYLRNIQRRGVIPTLEERCRKYEDDLARAEKINADLTSARSSLCDKKAQSAYSEKTLAAVNAELDNISCCEAGQRLEAINDAKCSAAAAQARFESARAALGGNSAPETRLLEALVDDNSNLTMCAKDMEELTRELDAEEKALDALKKTSPFFGCDAAAETKRAKTLRIAATALFILAAALAAASAAAIASGVGLLFWALASLAVVSCAAGAVFAVMNAVRAKCLGFKGAGELISSASGFAVLREKARAATERINTLDKRYADRAAEHKRLSDSVGQRVNEFMPGQSGNYDASIRKIYTAAAEIGSRKAEWLRSDELYNKLNEGADISALAEMANRAVEPKRTRAEAERERDFERSRLNSLRSAVTELEKRCSSLEAQSESPAVITSKLEVTERRLDEANAQFRALSLALDVLDESCNYMKSTVSPKLAELTGKYLREATGGRYPTVALTTDLEMTYDDSGMTRSADFLSYGARDSAYLCMRFALVELIFDKDRPFILLDDAFSRLDDGRLAAMLDVVNDLSDRQQVFILTCRTRERELLGAAGVPFATLNLGDRA